MHPTRSVTTALDGTRAVLVALLALLLLASAGLIWDDAGLIWDDAGLIWDDASALNATDLQTTQLVVGMRAGASAADLDTGTVVADLDALGMVLVRDADAGTLASDPDVAFVTADTTLLPTGKATDGRADRSAADEIAAPKLWQHGATGAGQTIALIDTGVTEHRDLRGRVVYGPNLAGDGTNADRFGHGTVMAGLMAGDGSASDGRFTGVAPDASVLSIKVAGADGASDVSQVLAGLQWLVSCQRANGGGNCTTTHDAGVLVLAYSTDSRQSAAIDPVAYALQRVLDAGIVVITSSGNGGDGTSGTVSGPGSAPAAFTVGAYDAGRKQMAPFTGIGPTVDGLTKPEVLASGVDLVAPVDTDSTIARNAPAALRDGGYIRGSGTSQAAALAGGLAALARQAHPTADATQVRGLLAASTAQVTGAAGRLDAGRLPRSLVGRDLPAFRGNGTGSLHASRGRARMFAVVDGQQILIDGEYTATGQTWDATTWANADWTGTTWTGTTWTGTTWTGTTWDGSTWDGSTWDGGTWDGQSWDGQSWDGSTWDGGTWDGSTWDGQNWDAASWG